VIHAKKNKSRTQKLQGLLEPLPIPERNWKDLAQDFTTDLPKTGRGKDTIHVVIDRKSKMAHFIPVRKSDDAKSTANSFAKNIVRLHGIPETIVSDRDPRFTSNFWQELFKILEVKIALSSARHAQTDGQSEKMMNTVKQYLRIFCNYNQIDWNEWLWMAEFAYNGAVQASTGITPFQIVYGYQPFTPISLIKYQEGMAGQKAVDQVLSNQKTVLKECKTALQKIGLNSEPNLKYTHNNPFEEIARKNMEEAQKKYSKYANRKRSEVQIKKGDLVLISTKDLDVTSYTSRTCKALSPRYIGPYLVIKEISKTSFRVRLPGHVTLHPVFHASQLVLYKKPIKEVKAFTGYIPKVKDIPLIKILNRKVQAGSTYYLAKWLNNEEHWVPARNLENAHQLIIQWEDSI
jgi:hypothetical protein